MESWTRREGATIIIDQPPNTSQSFSHSDPNADSNSNSDSEFGVHTRKAPSNARYPCKHLVVIGNTGCCALRANKECASVVKCFIRPRDTMNYMRIPNCVSNVLSDPILKFDLSGYLLHRVVAYRCKLNHTGLPFRSVIVHHLDGVKSHNDSSNLEVLTVEEHDARHHRLMPWNTT